jgi:hypothetical protein
MACRKNSPGKPCCCPGLGDLPDVTIEGFTEVSPGWVVDSVNCCAQIVFEVTAPVVCTFYDGGDIDLNTSHEEVDQVLNIRLETYTAPIGNLVLGTWVAPAQPCPACSGFTECARQVNTTDFTKATRFGMRYAPWRIYVKICKRDITCDGITSSKIVVESRYIYLVDTMQLNYQRTQESETRTASNCCSVTTGAPSDINDWPYDPSEPQFWGYPSVFSYSWTVPSSINFGYIINPTGGGIGPSEDSADQQAEFVRYKVYDEIPTGLLTFDNTDCPDCDELTDCNADVCYVANGASDPPGEGTSWCTAPEITTSMCTIGQAKRCTPQWYYTDETGRHCVNFAIRSPISCSNTSGTIWFSGDDAINSCDFTFPLGGSNWVSQSGCATSSQCGDFTEVSDSVADIDNYELTRYCSGGTEGAEICIIAPTWEVTFS